MAEKAPVGPDRVLLNNAAEIEQLIEAEDISYGSIVQVPAIGDALSRAEIEELADDADALKEFVGHMRLLAAHWDEIHPRKRVDA